MERRGQSALADGAAPAWPRRMAMTAPVPSFDTLSYARRLKEAGVDEAQAETHAKAVGDAVTEGAVTKADLAVVEPTLPASKRA